MFHYLKHNLALSVTVAGRGSTNGLLCPAPLLCYASFVFTFCRSSLFRYLITLSPENRLARSLSVAATEKKTGAAQAGDPEIDGTSKVEGEGGRGATDRAATIEVRGDQTGIVIFHNFLRQRRLVQHPPPYSRKAEPRVIHLVGDEVTEVECCQNNRFGRWKGKGGWEPNLRRRQRREKRTFIITIAASPKSTSPPPLGGKLHFDLKR